MTNVFKHKNKGNNIFNRILRMKKKIIIKIQFSQVLDTILLVTF